MNLQEIQSAFQAGVLSDEASLDLAVLASIKDSRRTDAATLFDVYVDGYRLRLAEFVANDFPVLREHMGEEAFGGLVADYIDRQPSRIRNARWYASRLPEFMRGTSPWRSDPCACDLACFERALADAFDAPDAPALAMNALMDVGAENWPRLVFGFHPSVKILELSAGTASSYEALTSGEEAPELTRDRETVLFWRSEGDSYYRVIADAERLAVLEGTAGKNFGEICALLAFQQDDEDMPLRLAGLLQQWFSDGLVVTASSW